jgi:hypothetical protein
MSSYIEADGFVLIMRLMSFVFITKCNIHICKYYKVCEDITPTNYAGYDNV